MGYVLLLDDQGGLILTVENAAQIYLFNFS